MVCATAILKTIYLVIIVTIVCSTMETIAWFSHIHHCQIFAIYKHMYWLKFLCIDIKAACCQHLLGYRILDTRTAICPIIVSPIANHQLFILAIWFVVKYRIIEMAITIIQFLRLYLKRCRFEMATPSTSNFKTCFLIDNHLTICCQILEVDWTFPVHIEIRLPR